MPSSTSASPRWNPSTKLIAGFTLVAIIAALLVRFSGFLGPLLLAFILSYLLHPWVRRLSETTRLSWRAAVGIAFLFFLIVFITLLVMAGFAIVEQLGNLVSTVQDFFVQLPETLRGLSEHALQFGPFQINFANLERTLVEGFNMDFASIGQQLLSAVQPALGQAGSFLGALATSTLNTIGWILFIFIISYFILNDAGHTPDFLGSAEASRHNADLRRLGRELGRIWDTYLRGQLLLVSLIMLTSFTLMSLLGVRFALALALITGLAKFVPYIGSLAMYITTALVSFFQASNYLGIEVGTTYMLVATIPAILMDLSFDNLISPRFYGRALGVHPAAVLVTALVAASLLGFIGLLVAAPVLASLQLFATYVFRKMMDVEPWLRSEVDEPPGISLLQLLQPVLGRLKSFFAKLRKGRRKKK
ncbi:MAG: AI-2E family transporter [Anaerolineales bacterium]